MCSSLNKKRFYFCQHKRFFFLKAKYQNNLLKDSNFNDNHKQPKCSALQNKFTKMLNTMENSLLWGSKLIYPNPFKIKHNLVIYWTKSFLKLKIEFHAPISLKDPASCMSWLGPHTRYRANTFLNHWGQIYSTLWDSHGGSALQSIVDD